jgi:tetratricopeptide (TPR) repeat protein
MKVLCLILLTLPVARGQSADSLFGDGLRLENSFHTTEALARYARAIQLNPQHVEALTHTSRMLSNRAGHNPDREQKIKDLLEAEVLSRKAISLRDKSTDAHFSLIVTLGLQAESAGSPREKIRNAKSIREEAETILRLDSTYALAWFVLGKWHHELSRLNWYERLACEWFFGGLPEGISMDKAVYYFNRALQLEPESILFLYGQAISLHYLQQDEQARVILKKAMQLPLKDPDDSIRKEKCAALLKEIT